MIARGFKPVGWVAGVGAAALGCYMLSLNVASERAELAKIEREIIMAKQDIRELETELGTRGRLTQLESWNAEVLALSAPASKQFLQDEFRLASFTEPQRDLDEQAADVRLASAEQVKQPSSKPAIVTTFDNEPSPEASKPLVRKASLVVNDAQPVPAKPAVKAPAPKPVTKVAAAEKPATVKKAAVEKESPALKAAAAKSPAAKKKGGLIDDKVVAEIGAVANSEKKGGANAR